MVMVVLMEKVILMAVMGRRGGGFGVVRDLFVMMEREIAFQEIHADEPESGPGVGLGWREFRGLGQHVEHGRAQHGARGEAEVDLQAAMGEDGGQREPPPGEAGKDDAEGVNRQGDGHEGRSHRRWGDASGTRGDQGKPESWFREGSGFDFTRTPGAGLAGGQDAVLGFRDIVDALLLSPLLFHLKDEKAFGAGEDVASPDQATTLFETFIHGHDKRTPTTDMRNGSGGCWTSRK